MKCNGYLKHTQEQMIQSYVKRTVKGIPHCFVVYYPNEGSMSLEEVTAVFDVPKEKWSPLFKEVSDGDILFFSVDEVVDPNAIILKFQPYKVGCEYYNNGQRVV